MVMPLPLVLVCQWANVLNVSACCESPSSTWSGRGDRVVR